MADDQLRIEPPFWIDDEEEGRTIAVRVVNDSAATFRHPRVSLCWVNETPQPVAGKLPPEVLEMLQGLPLDQPPAFEQESTGFKCRLNADGTFFHGDCTPGREFVSLMGAKDVERLRSFTAALSPERYHLEVRDGMDTVAALDGAALGEFIDRDEV